jgi:hypothetical protein
MIGYPKYLNTKEDYLYVKDNFPRKDWESDFQRLLDTRMEWLNVGQLESSEAGVTDDTRKVVTVGEDDMSMGAVQHYQYEYREDPNCTLLRLGFTVDEVEAILTSQ